MNKVIIIGRLTKDPEIRVAGTTNVCSFAIAVDRSFVKQGEERKADFINCKAFSKTGEFVQKYFSKGSKIALEGRIQTGSFDKEGVKVYTTDIIVEQVEFVEKKSNDNTENGNNSDGFYDPNSEDELPFN